MKHSNNPPVVKPDRVELHRKRQVHAALLNLQFRAEELNEYVAKVVAEAPPRTSAQCDRLVLVLRAAAQNDGSCPPECR